MDKFYSVTFNNEQPYYFRDLENASAFLLEAYCDDHDDLNEEQLAAVNEEVADTWCIDKYGVINECYFEA
jgi:hypothetical protein